MASSGENAQDSFSWVDETFMAQALSEGEGTPVVTVLSLKVEPAVKAGANFMSSLRRVTFEVLLEGGKEAERRSLVLKVMLTAGAMAQLAQEGDVFEREVRTYRELLPRYEEALRAAGAWGGAADWRPLAPRALASGPGGGGRPAWLLLQDLRADGFTTPSPDQGLDHQHCALALATLARLHAASVLLLVSDPSLATDALFHRSPLTGRDACEQLSQIVPRHARALSQALAASGRRRLAERYEAAAERIVPALARLDSDKPALAVLLHGDVWKNNFLFRYDGRRPTDVRLLDYQMVNLGSPATDVVHFLYANASEDTHRHHLESLVAEYHGALVATLRALGLQQQADAYPLEALWAEVRRRGPIALHCAVLMGVVLGVEEHGEDIEQSYSGEQGGADRLANVYGNPAYLSCIEFLSARFEEQGVL